ncbi:ribosome assembly RNA-binding protein YhbY [Ligilactobacillus apodemi]|uniref:ribosome assembly RNA-binding protein YhbY n=1 Tax=Ligilactobacillus apodemi TaxID=307126 RepID=UPI00214B0033|nr:ribosome assembly RNA-binding protein YhbY [Ligilactobacillus apodemi]MCR1900524.1 ribosome assembly RNA-binding protein YhbY [Ligilactobacillus apodemi]
MQLKGKQKRYLRAQAHDMRPLFQVGKEGLSANWLAQIEDAIEKRELFKVNILQNALVEDEEVIAFIEENTDIQVVQKIGHVLVLFKQANKKDNRSHSLEVAKL